MVCSLFVSSGYVLFSGVTNFGDAAVLIAGLQPRLLWRGGLARLTRRAGRAQEPERPGRRRIDAGGEVDRYEDADEIWGESPGREGSNGEGGQKPRTSLNAPRRSALMLM